MKYILRLTLLSAILVLTGCATVSKPALTAGAASVDVSAQSLVLMTLNVRNDHKDRYQPNKQMAVVFKPQGSTSNSDHISQIIKNESFRVNADGSTEVLFNVSLTPGNWEVVKVWGTAWYLPTYSTFTIQLDSPISVPAQSVVYLGRLEGRIRPRAEGEFRAGIVIPLIDQRVAGFSNGTFDIRIGNDLNQVLPDMRSQYPALASQNIQFAPGLSFDRAPLDAKMAGK